MPLITATPKRAADLKQGITFLQRYTGQLIAGLNDGSPVTNTFGQPNSNIRAILREELPAGGKALAQLMWWNPMSTNFIVSVFSQVQFGTQSFLSKVKFKLKMTTDNGNTVVFETDPIFPLSDTGTIAIGVSDIYNAIMATGVFQNDEVNVTYSNYTGHNATLEGIDFHIDFKGRYTNNPDLKLEAIQVPNTWYKLTLFLPDLSRQVFSSWYYKCVIPFSFGGTDYHVGDPVYPANDPLYTYNGQVTTYWWGMAGTLAEPWLSFFQSGYFIFQPGAYGQPPTPANTSYFVLHMTDVDGNDLFTTNNIELLGTNYLLDINKDRLFLRLSEQGLDGVSDPSNPETDFTIITDTESFYYRSWWICFKGDTYGLDDNILTISDVSAAQVQLTKLAKPWTLYSSKNYDVVTDVQVTVYDVVRGSPVSIPRGDLVVCVPFADVEYGVVETSSRFKNPPAPVYPYYPYPYGYFNGFYGPFGYGPGYPFPYYPNAPYYGYPPTTATP